jgi:hypothetical protein
VVDSEWAKAWIVGPSLADLLMFEFQEDDFPYQVIHLVRSDDKRVSRRRKSVPIFKNLEMTLTSRQSGNLILSI